MLTYLVDVVKFLCCVESSKLGGESDVNQSWVYSVVLVAVVHIVVEILVECLGFHLTIIIGNGYDFVLGELYSTSLVYVDMTAANTNHTLVLIQHRVDGGGIGLGTASQKENLGIRQSAGYADALFGTFAKLIKTIRGWFGIVVFNQVLQNFWMSPVVVVTFK